VSTPAPETGLEPVTL